MKIKSSYSVIIRIVLWLMMLLGGAVAAYVNDRDSNLFHDPVFHLVTAALGVFVIAMAFRAAGNGGRELSSGRVGELPRLETNRLVTSGIYGCMRHPMLFGLTLLPLGWALLLGLPTFIVLIAPLEILFIIVMVVVFEEMEVRHKFGDDYRVYARRVPMVSFSFSCLKKLFAKKISRQHQEEDLKAHKIVISVNTKEDTF